MSKIGPFRETPLCRKCGSDKVKASNYCGPEFGYQSCHRLNFDVTPARRVARYPLVDSEHLHRICQCGHEWREWCRDADDGRADDPVWLYSMAMV